MGAGVGSSATLFPAEVSGVPFLSKGKTFSMHGRLFRLNLRTSPRPGFQTSVETDFAAAQSPRPPNEPTALAQCRSVRKLIAGGNETGVVMLLVVGKR